jgi:hypothetical protein
MRAADEAPPRRLRDTLDLMVALAALVTSVVSIWLAISQGDDMARLVQAQSWPFVGFSSGNTGTDALTGARKRSLSFSVENLGVGPAKIRSFEISIDGRPVTDHTALISAAHGAAVAEPLRDDLPILSTAVNGRVLRPGETITFLRWDHDPTVDAPWTALDRARFGRLGLRVCYCSVFDECWIGTLQSTEAEPVAACPAIDSYRE